MAFPHISQKQLRHLCNYFGDALCDHSSNTISIHCPVNFKVMFAAYSNSNESICFESRMRIWVQREHVAMMLCGFGQRRDIVCAKSPDAVSHNVISVMLQIRALDLAAQHQRLLTNQAHAKLNQSPTDWQTHTYSQEFIASVRLYSTLCLYLQVSRHTNMITSHKLHLSLPALPTSDKDVYLSSLLKLSVCI